MSPALVLDASVLIALIGPLDAHHADARRLVRMGAQSGPLLAHRITLAESAVGAARSGRADLLRTSYSRLGIAVVDSDDEEPWRLAQLRADTALSMPDCCVLDAAIRHRAGLGTFDQRLAAVAAGYGVRVA